LGSSHSDRHRQGFCLIASCRRLRDDFDTEGARTTTGGVGLELKTEPRPNLRRVVDTAELQSPKPNPNVAGVDAIKARKAKAAASDPTC
jgi:hypothetical protein